MKNEKDVNKRRIFVAQCLLQTKENIEEQRENLQIAESEESSDVETELFIGLPDKRMKQDRSK